jgi:tetratricopeptide (TPR) repeat protein
MKATNVFIVLTLATAACAAIGVGIYFNHNEDFASNGVPSAETPVELAQVEATFGPETAAPASVEATSPVESSVPETAVAQAARSIDVETLQAARVAFEQRDHETVLELLGDTGSVEGAAYDVHYLRGLTLRYVGRYEDSAAEMDAALAIDPRSVRALVNSARTLIQLERFAEAEARAQAAVDIDATDADAWNVLGRAKLNLRDMGAAVEAFARATELDPQNAHAFNNKGYALLQQQQWQAAADALETAITLRNDVAWFHNNVGICYEQLGRPEEAVLAWQRALELQPAYDKVTISLARVEPQIEAIAAELARAPEIDAKTSDDVTSNVAGEETLRAGSDSQPQTDVVDVDGMEAGSDSRSSHSGSDATEETPEGSVSPQ